MTVADVYGKQTKNILAFFSVQRRERGEIGEIPARPPPTWNTPIKIGAVSLNRRSKRCESLDVILMNILKGGHMHAK